MKKQRKCLGIFFLMAVGFAVLSALSACKQPGGENSQAVTITVKGDGNVSGGKGSTFSVDKGTKWASLKTKSEITGITFKNGWELSSWKLNDAQGTDLTDDYAFNADTAVFAVSKKLGSGEKITITIQGDDNVQTGKGGTLSIDKGAKWRTVKTNAEITGITFKNGWELSSWKLNNAQGASLTNDYTFTANTVVFAVSKKSGNEPRVTITVDGDDNIETGKGSTFTVVKGTKWEEVKAKDEIDSITPKAGWEISVWKLNNAQGTDLTDDYAFNSDTKVFAVTKKLQAVYVKVPYAELDEYLADKASTKTINYIELTDIPEGKLTGKSAFPLKSSELGGILNLHKQKKVGLKFPDTVANLTDMSACFFECKTLISVANIPNGVENMRYCFDACENLEEAPVIPASVNDMQGCFRNCKNLKKAPVIPSTVTNIYLCFSYCENLMEVPSVPSGAENLGYCFFGCKKLINAPVIPEGIKDMRGCFAECESLVTAPAIPSTVTNMSECFKDCTSLTTPPQTIPASVKNMKKCFSGCVKLASAPALSEGIDDMTSSFSGCKFLTAAPVIPSSVTGMQGCFSECTALTAAPAIPENVISLELCFYACTSLTQPPASIPASVRSMANCFSECNNLTSAPAIIEEGVTNMSFCFKNCTKITVPPVIPSTVTDMSYCFIECTALNTAPIIPANVTNMESCFSGCTALTAAPAIPEGVTNLGYCFFFCENLLTAPTSIPESVKNMEACFLNCSKLKTAVLNCAYVENDFNNAFKGCKILEAGGIKVKNEHLNKYQENAAAMGTTQDKFAAQ